MRNELGADHEVLEEGLNGRTTVWEDPIEEHKCGKDHLIPIIKTHQPFDLLIIMLGTNDLKKRFSLSAFDIAQGAGTLVGTARTTDDAVGGDAPEILLIAPPVVGKLTDFAAMFEGAKERSQQFGAEFKRVSDEMACPFLDIGPFIQSSDVDGIHLDEDNQKKSGLAIAEKVKEILG